MKTLMIKDLSRTEALDAKAMAAISGGTGLGSMKLPYFSPLFSSSTDVFKFDASQEIGQSQNTLVNNGNNAAFVSGITSTVNPKQTANNNINFL